MNYIWCIMMVGAFVCAIINGRVEETMAAMFSGAENSVKIMLSFCGLMCFWNGILNVAHSSGLCKVLNKIFSPIVNFLFAKESDMAKEYITMNITANMLGMGNAATPMGIKAMECMQKSNPKKTVPSRAMCTFVVLNTTSFTIIPSTVLSLRAAAGSLNPESVLLPIWFASLTSLIIAVVAVRLLQK